MHTVPPILGLCGMEQKRPYFSVQHKVKYLEKYMFDTLARREEEF